MHGLNLEVKVGVWHKMAHPRPGGEGRNFGSKLRSLDLEVKVRYAGSILRSLDLEVKVRDFDSILRSLDLEVKFRDAGWLVGGGWWWLLVCRRFLCHFVL